MKSKGQFFQAVGGPGSGVGILKMLEITDAGTKMFKARERHSANGINQFGFIKMFSLHALLDYYCWFILIFGSLPDVIVHRGAVPKSNPFPRKSGNGFNTIYKQVYQQKAKGKREKQKVKASSKSDRR